MRKTSSDTGEPWCAPTREVEKGHMLALARQTKRTGKQPVAPRSPTPPQAPRYELATLEERELADGSNSDLIDPFATPSRVVTVVVPAPGAAAEGKTWALVLAIVLMLATAGGIAAIVLFL
jgi:hypothetical protein